MHTNRRGQSPDSKPAGELRYTVRAYRGPKQASRGTCQSQSRPSLVRFLTEKRVTTRAAMPRAAHHITLWYAMAP
jgi:hypothetical protein